MFNYLQSGFILTWQTWQILTFHPVCLSIHVRNSECPGGQLAQITEARAGWTAGFASDTKQSWATRLLTVVPLVSRTLTKIPRASSFRMTSPLPQLEMSPFSLEAGIWIYTQNAPLRTSTSTVKITHTGASTNRSAPIMSQAQNTVLCLLVI